MSTILDALEKASRKSGGGPGASAGPSLRERQLEKEVERGRRMTILAAAGLLLVGLGAIASMMLFTRRAPAPVSPPRGAGSRVDAARPTPAAELPVVAATPPPSPVPTATPAPTPTPDAPARTPEPTPTPRPPMATTTAAALRPYLKDGQLITAADLGWKIEGVMELGDTSFAMIDGDQVQTGTVYRGYHLVGVTTGLLTFDLGDGRIVKVAY